MNLYDLHLPTFGVFRVMAPSEHHVLAVLLTWCPEVLDLIGEEAGKLARVALSLSQPVPLSFEAKAKVVGFFRA